MNKIKALVGVLHSRIYPSENRLKWDKPDEITYGEPLDERHLNALLNNDSESDGVFKYDPPLSTVLRAGDHVLSVIYTPNDLQVNKKSRILKASTKITVQKAIPILTWKTPQPIYYGTQLSRKQLNAACINLPGGEYTYSPAMRAVISEGTHDLKVDYEPDDEHKANYKFASKTVTIIIIPLKQPIISWTDPLPIVYNTLLGCEQLNATIPGFEELGTIIYEPSAGTLLAATDAQQLLVSFTPFNKIEVRSADARVRLQILKAESLLVWEQPRNIYFGAPLTKLQLAAVCINLNGGSFNYSHKLNDILPEGTHELSVEFTPEKSKIKNYDGKIISVSLTVMPLHQPVFIWPTPAHIIYGAALSELQLNAVLEFPLHGFGFEYQIVGDWTDHGTITYIPPIDTILEVGTDIPLTVTFDPFNKFEVLTASATVLLQVIRADPVIVWANPETILMHTLLSEAQLNAVCTRPFGPEGQFVYSPKLGTHLPVGTHTLAVTYLPSYQHKRNYNNLTMTVDLRVDKPEPAMRWLDPVNCHVGRPLTTKHLNAICVEPGIPEGSGTYDYDPPLGSLLPLGNKQALHLRYRVADEFEYSYREASCVVFINVIPPRIPTLTWNAPAPIPFGSKLTQFQLNASCNVQEGFLYYEPGRGTVLASGETHTLKVTFIPNDHLEWASISMEVPIYIFKTDPMLTWTPATYFFAGMALTIDHLNCQLSKNCPPIKGVMNYKPQLGAVLGAGTHILTASFQCDKQHKREWNDITMQIEFTVSPKIKPVCIWPNPEAIIFGSALTAEHLNATSDVPGHFEYFPPVGIVLDANDEGQALSILSATFLPTNTIEYISVQISVPLLVKKAIPKLIWTPPPFLYIGTPLLPKHLNATSPLPGTFVYCPEENEVLPLGSHTMTVIFKPADSIKHNWTFSSSFVTMLVITEGSLFKLPKRYLEPETHRSFHVDDREFLLEADTNSYYSSQIDCFPPEPVRIVVEKMKNSKSVEKDKLMKGEIDLSWTIKASNSKGI